MKSSVRWLVPVAVAATVAGGVAVGSAQAGNTPNLRQRTPQQVLQSVAGSTVTALSGTVVTRADLGLPSISGLAPSSDATTDPTGLITRFLSGNNTLRVWVDGPTRQRAQLLDPFSELDVVRNGSDVWTYSSRGNLVRHGTLPARTAAKGHDSAKTGTAATDLTPAQLADKAIAAADPTTAVSLGDPEVVAGRNAYALTLTPKTDGTLIERIVIAVDAERGVPLQVKVFARGHSQPAIETGFTQVDFGTPSADRFSFTPPKGATVSPLDTPGASPGTTKPSLAAADRPTVIGSGWTSIVEVPVGAIQAMATQRAADGSGRSGGPSFGGPDHGRQAQGMAALEQLTTPVANGGRAISTALVSVLITSDGRVFAGSVPVQSLVDAAAKK